MDILRSFVHISCTKKECRLMKMYRQFKNWTNGVNAFIFVQRHKNRGDKGEIYWLILKILTFLTSHFLARPLI